MSCKFLATPNLCHGIALGIEPLLELSHAFGVGSDWRKPAPKVVRSTLLGNAQTYISII